MRIASSDISFASSQINVKTTSSHEHLRTWNATSDVTIDVDKANGILTDASLRKKETFNGTKVITGQPAFPSQSSDQDDLLTGLDEEFFGSVKERVMKDLVEIMTGKKIILLDPSPVRGSGTPSNAAHRQEVPTPQSVGQGPGQEVQGWGVDYYRTETQTTKKGVTVSASGSVTTADGNTIDFSALLEMSRETTDETTVSLKAGDALTDPLMIDTTGNCVQLSNIKFSFDLNADGASELINVPASGSGFLAYDKNGNGIIDDGSELFGPATGNGFSELSQFDADKNGWIDENDPIFNNLSLWQKSADGTDSIKSLKDSGIGAIYLGHAASRFDLTEGNTPGSTAVAGVLRDTGVFLREAGQTGQAGPAGFVQEVDLVA
jgi:hypothetical protein